MGTGIISAMAAILTCFAANGYNSTDNSAKSDSVRFRPDSSAVALEERFEKAELNPADSPKLKFSTTHNYPNPF